MSLEFLNDGTTTVADKPAKPAKPAKKTKKKNGGDKKSTSVRYGVPAVVFVRLQRESDSMREMVQKLTAYCIEHLGAPPDFVYPQPSIATRLQSYKKKGVHFREWGRKSRINVEELNAMGADDTQTNG